MWSIITVIRKHRMSIGTVAAAYNLPIFHITDTLKIDYFRWLYNWSYITFWSNLIFAAWFMICYIANLKPVICVAAKCQTTFSLPCHIDRPTQRFSRLWTTNICMSFRGLHGLHYVQSCRLFDSGKLPRSHSTGE